MIGKSSTIKYYGSGVALALDGPRRQYHEAYGVRPHSELKSVVLIIIAQVCVP